MSDATPKKQQLHWSHINMFLRCGEQYRRRYIMKEIIPPAVVLHVGSGTHKGVEVNLLHKRDKGELLPVDAVAEATRDAVNERWEKEGVTLDADDMDRAIADVRGEAVDTAVALATLHHSELAPKITPQHVERPWVLELSGFPYDLAGQIDIQEKPVNGCKAGRIRDTKTTNRTPPPSKADESDQLTMYALAAKVLDGAIPPLAMDSLVKTKTPKAVTLETWRTDEDLQVLLRRIEVFSRALDRGVFVPAQQDSWICSAKFCGYAATCPYFRGRVQA